MSKTRYYRCISQLQLKAGKINLLLPNIPSLARKQNQKERITSGLDKQSFFHWSDSKHKCYAVFNIRVPSMHHETMMKKVWCKVFLNSHPKYKESIQKLDAKSRNSPGQCLGITKDLRTTGDYVASHKLSCKRSWQCSLLLTWVNRLPLPVRGLTISLKKEEKKKKTKEEHTVMQLIVDESQKHLAAAVPDRFSSLCCHWFSSPRSAWKKKKKKRGGREIYWGEERKTHSKQYTDK